MGEIEDRSTKAYVSPACFAIYRASLGHADCVFAFLNAAFAERDPYLTRVDAEPYFAPFRSDQRYRDLW